MSICSVCGHENTYGTLVCVQCFTLLAKSSPILDAQDTPTWQEMTSNTPPGDLRATRPVTHQLGTLTPGTLALYIDENDVPLVIQIKNEILLGRHTENGTSQPHVDLSPYNAYGKGISRLHAAIRRTENRLFIEDLGSTNGSWLNNKRLMPFSAHTLQSGDVIQLSQLLITAYFS